MRPHERRMAIWHSLCCCRQTTIARLDEEHKVCPRTIYYDVEILSLIYPIESVRGRYHGGIKLPDWYTPNPNRYSPAQMELLLRIQEALEGNDLIIMNSIISQFSS